MTPATFLRFAEALKEPSLLVSGEGDILAANVAARRVLALPRASRPISLPDLACDAQATRRYLAACSGTASAVPGHLRLRSPEGKVLRLRCNGARVSSAAGSRESARKTTLLLQCQPQSSDDRFVALTRQVEELHAQIRRREEAQAALRHALAERDAYLRELQHRVRNNLQTLLALINLGRDAAQGEEAQQVLQQLTDRVFAIAETHRLLQDASIPGMIPAEMLLHAVCGVVGRRHGLTDEHFALEAAPIMLPAEQALGVGLLVAEMLMQAAGTQAASAEPQTVSLEHEGGDMLLLRLPVPPRAKGNGEHTDVTRQRITTALIQQLEGTVFVMDHRWAMRFPISATAPGA